MILIGNPYMVHLLHRNDTSLDALKEKAKAKVGAEKKSQSIGWFTTTLCVKKPQSLIMI